MCIEGGSLSLEGVSFEGNRAETHQVGVDLAPDPHPIFHALDDDFKSANSCGSSSGNLSHVPLSPPLGLVRGTFWCRLSLTRRV